MNVEDVQTKLDLVTDNLVKLTSLPTTTYGDFTSDFRNVDSALHRLQTSVQALIDIAAYVASSLGLRTPTSSVDVIETLREAGHVPDERAAVYTKMVQFRNRVVHLYNRIDTGILYQILTAELDDLRECCDRLLTLIETHPD